MDEPRFIVWTNYGVDGWARADCDTFDAAVKERESRLPNECIITEYVPIRVQDGRKPQSTPLHPHWGANVRNAVQPRPQDQQVGKGI
jgi:hypothetical protein